MSEGTTLGLRRSTEVRCPICKHVVIRQFCLDQQDNVLTCLRCAAAGNRLEPGRFVSLSIDARGQAVGVDFLPAGAAIAVLMRHGWVAA